MGKNAMEIILFVAKTRSNTSIGDISINFRIAKVSLFPVMVYDNCFYDPF